MGSKKPRDGIVLFTRPAGHDSSVVHQFNHSGGECPKCSSKAHLFMFCLPGQNEVPRVQGCEVDGEHIHRQCSNCGYPWVERTYDQLVQSQEEGWLIAESQLMAALACVARKQGGITMEQAVVLGYRGFTLRFKKDDENHTIVITAEETDPDGAPTHPELRHQGPQGRGA